MDHVAAAAPPAVHIRVQALDKPSLLSGHKLRTDSRFLRNSIRLLAWLVLIAIVVATVSPLSDRPHLGVDTANFERAIGFATLGCLFGVGYRQHRMAALWFVLFAAIGLELAQLLVADRHARVMDAEVKALAGALGVVVGALSVDVIGHYRRVS